MWYYVKKDKNECSISKFPEERCFSFTTIEDEKRQHVWEREMTHTVDAYSASDMIDALCSLDGIGSTFAGNSRWPSCPFISPPLLSRPPQSLQIAINLPELFHCSERRATQMRSSGSNGRGCDDSAVAISWVFAWSGTTDLFPTVRVKMKVIERYLKFARPMYTIVPAGLAGLGWRLSSVDV